MLDKKDKVLLLTGASSEVGCGLLEAVIDNYQYVWSHFNRSEDIAEEWKRQYGKRSFRFEQIFLMKTVLER